MATSSPPPNASPTAAPPSPPSTTSPPPSNTSTPPSSQPSSPPPTISPPSEPNANPPDPSTPSTPPPAQPPVSPPPPQNASPPPLASTTSPPPPQQSISPTSPPTSPPVSNPPPPAPEASNTPPPSSSPPPPPVSNPPRSSPPSSPASTSPTNSPPPPPVASPPTSPSPPPVASPPTSPSPPPVANPPTSPPPSPPVANPPTSPPPPSPVANPPTSPPPPPNSSPPPPKASAPQPKPSTPPNSSPPPPPPPSTVSPQSPPPSSSSTPPTSSAPAPAVPPSNAAPPTNQTPSPPPSGGVPSGSNSSINSSPPPALIRLSPPPPQTPASPNLNGPSPSSPESSSPSDNGGISTTGLVVIGVAVGIIALTLIGLVVWCLRKRRKEPSALHNVYVAPSPLGSSHRSETSYTKTAASAPLIRSGGSGSESVYSSKEPGGLGNSRSLFTYEELVKATDGFSTQNLLGEGGFGSVYKGYLPDGRDVAIKQLKIGGGQGEREFKAEVEIISRIHHRHLVSLVGYCVSENRRLLIYDYVPNNTLYFHLHEGRPVLDWATRVKIAAGAARGIAYLHEDCHPRIIHRDIKSSNILLDNNFEAQVSDFGLAKLTLDANTHVTTRVMGTFGYMAPEYASSGKLTEKSDVFSFGVVLLELITGRKPVDTSQPVGDESLVEWARPLLSHALDNEEFDGLADPKLGKDYVESEMFRMIEAAAACVRHSAAKRPRMGQVVRAFDSLATSDLSNGMRVGESEIFNTAQQSEEIRWFRRMAFGSQNYSTDFFSQGSKDN